MKRLIARSMIVLIIMFSTALVTSRVLAASAYISESSSDFSLSSSYFWNIIASYCDGGHCFQYLQYTGGNGNQKGKWTANAVPNNVNTNWYAYIPNDTTSAFDGAVAYKGASFATTVYQENWKGQWVYLGNFTKTSVSNNTAMANTCVSGMVCDANRQVWWDTMRVDY